MSAKEMFEELGYKLKSSYISENYNYMDVVYEHRWYDYEDNYIDSIHFMTNDFFTESIILDRQLNGCDNNIELSKKTIKAIQKQIEELGW